MAFGVSSLPAGPQEIRANAIIPAQPDLGMTNRGLKNPITIPTFLKTNFGIA
jgi:hypothetical protein